MLCLMMLHACLYPTRLGMFSFHLVKYLVYCLYKYLFFPSLASCGVSLLLLGSSSFIMMCVGVFSCVLFEVHCAFWICGFIFFIKLGMASVIISLNKYYASLSISSTSGILIILISAILTELDISHTIASFLKYLYYLSFSTCII